MAVKQVLQARMEKHIKEMVTTNPMIGQLNTQFTSWLLGSGLTGTEIIQMIDSNMDAVIQPTELSDALQRTTGTQPLAGSSMGSCPFLTWTRTET